MLISIAIIATKSSFILCFTTLLKSFKYQKLYTGEPPLFNYITTQSLA